LAVLTTVRVKLGELLDRAESGDLHSYLEISSILQKIYCRGKSRPLMETLSNAIGFDILVAIHFSPEEEVDAGLLPAEMTGHMHPKEISNVVTWLTCGHALVDVLDAVNRREVKIYGRDYSYSEIINMAHKNLSVSRSVLGVDAPSAESELIMYRTLLDISRTSVNLIDLIEDSIKNKTHSQHFRKRK